MKMRGSSVSSAFFFLLSVFVHGAHNLDYSDIEAMGLSCPARDKCGGYRNNLTYLDRSCECDSACGTYQDCCIDAPRMGSRSRARSTSRNGMVCMPYGERDHAGVYVIAHCSRYWNGSPEIREKCEGLETDLSDPLVAAPVTSVAQAVTYRNRYCAECNNAALASLSVFQLLMGCDSLPDVLSNEQLLADATYNQTLNVWGINRLNSFGNETLFYICDIAFDVPGYLNNSVRFCRSDLVSSCPQTWTRQYVRTACEEYMAVVFENGTAYRNPHCAICNNKTVNLLSCTDSLVTGRKRPMSFALLLDVNPSDGDQVGMRKVTTPECAANEKYDPFFKRCRKLVCALPGHEVRNGRCVNSS